MKKEAGAQEEHDAEEEEDKKPELDLTQFDPFERLFLNDATIFLEPNGEDESQESATARYKFANALKESAPHHASKLKTWELGNCYQFIQLVTVSVRETGRTPYQAFMALSKVTFTNNESIDDIINGLHGAQTKANHVKPGMVDETIMKGALLTACETQPDFKTLAASMSRIDYVGSHNDMRVELRECEEIA